MIMAETRAYIQARVERIGNPAAMLTALNDCLYEDLTRAELFITMFYLNYDADTHKLFFANAGHNPPLLWRSKAKNCEWLDAEGLILGVKRKMVFEEKWVQMHLGDVLLLYTDGITEATAPDGAFFGENRLRDMLAEYHGLPPEQIIDCLFRRLRSFTGTQSLVDDVSLVVMKVES